MFISLLLLFAVVFFKLSMLGIHSRQQNLINVSENASIIKKKDLQDLTQNTKQEKYFHSTTV